MSTWFSKELGDGVAAHAPTTQIQETYSTLYIAGANFSMDMAVFSRYDLRANMVTVYFTPSAIQLARTFGAKPCEKPSKDDLALIVGDPRCWEILYPTSESTD